MSIVAMVVEPGGFRTEFSGRSLTQAAVPIEDYAQTAGPRRIEHDTAHGNQPGDPAKAARAIIDAVSLQSPPVVLVLGSDALRSFRASLEAWNLEAETWESVTTSTDVDV